MTMMRYVEFIIQYLCIIGGELQGMPHDWVLLKFTIINAGMIWHIG